MSLKDEVEELREWKEQQEKDRIEREKKEAVEESKRGRIMLRCSTVLMGLWTIGLGIGAWVADHIAAVEAAIRAFIQAELTK